jgi:hypothetical protein
VRAVRGKRRATLRAAPKPTTQSTGDVAEILEGKYHIMETFYHRYKPEIVKLAESALEGQLENLITGGPTTGLHYGEATSSVENAFRNFLDRREMDGNPGVPTLAALRGVSHRFKHPYAKRAERPSFVDTGLYQASFVAEIKE